MSRLARMFVLACCACGAGGGPRDAAVSDGPRDAPSPDGGPTWSGPVPPAAPVLTPCPTGWREVIDVDLGLPVCDPWPEAGRESCTGASAHFPGESGCREVGDACPTGDWPDGLPSDRPILHVHAGATGGDGSLSAPFGTIGEALAVATDGVVVALAKGVHTGRARMEVGATLWGACAAAAIIDGAGSAFFLLHTDVPGVAVRNVTFQHGGGVFVNGGSLALRGVVLEDVKTSAIGAVTSSDVSLDDVVIRRVEWAGIQAADNVRVTVRRAFIGDTDWQAISLIDSIVTGEDVAIVDTALGAAFTAAVHDGASLALDRCAVEGAAAWVSDTGGALALRDVFVNTRGMAPADGETGGILVLGGGAVTLERVRIEGTTSAGVAVAEPGSTVDLADVIVRDVLPAPLGGGRAINVEVQGHVAAARVLVEDATEIAIVASDPGTALLLDDVTVRRTGADAAGTMGRALQAQLGATVTGSRVRFEHNREISLVAAGAGTMVDLEDADLRETRERACAESTCPGFGAGIGAGSYLGASLILRSVRSTHNAFAGVQVARGGELDLHVGEISDNPIGANAQVPGYDVRRLSDGVAYLRNGVNLDSTELPVPRLDGSGAPP